MGHNYVGTEHILLALLELEADDAGVLRGLGLGLGKEATEQAVTAALAQGARAHEEGA